MPTPLIIPSEIAQTLDRFDSDHRATTVDSVRQALVDARGRIAIPNEAENLGCWAELLAFSLIGTRTEDSPWNTFYGPMASGTDADGKTVYRPDIAEADQSVIDHWSWRARTICHPVLKARYADVAWDLCRAISGQRPDIKMANIAIDSYLKSLSSGLLTPSHDRFESVLRALDLASSINCTDRIDQSRSALLQLHQEEIAQPNGMWWKAFDRLFGDKQARATEGEIQKLADDLEGLVLRFSNISDPSAFNPHKTQNAARRLIRVHSRAGRTQNSKRLHEVIARTFEHFASLGDALLASAILQTSVNAYRDAGMSEDSRRVRILMQEKIGQSAAQMKPIGTTIEIPHDDVQKFVYAITSGKSGDALFRMAVQFLPRRGKIAEQIRATAKEAPLQAVITQKIMADDHVAAIIGSVEDDLEGRVIAATAQEFAFSGIWLHEALTKTIEIHAVGPEHLVSWANRSGIFDDLSLLLEGAGAWYDNDYVKTMHVLVPQVERGLRSIAARLGRPVTKQHPNVANASVAIGIGDILNDTAITTKLGTDMTLYFRSLYADPRGMNLRNRIAHGLIKPGNMNYLTANLLIHTLLVLGVWPELLEHNQRASRAD